MKKTMRRHILREIRGTLNRFVAIFAITALGAGFFAGLRATGADMEATADKYYNDQRLADMRLLSTFGFTDDDVAAIQATDGVDIVMPTYALDMLVGVGENQEAMRLHALPPDTSDGNPDYLNQVVLEEGRMPAAANEVLADVESGYAVGDRVQIPDTNDEDSLELLALREFTVVGRASSAYYISFSRGNTNIGNGTLDAYLFLHPEAFDSEYYLEILLTLAGAEGLSSFDQEYIDLAEGYVDLFEDFGGLRAEIRYDELVEEYNEEIADGQRELDEKRIEVDEELADAWKELGDAEQELEDARQELADGKLEIADARQTLYDAEKELADGEAELADGRAQLESGQRGYEDGKAQYRDGLAQYNEGLAAYEEGYAEYLRGRATWEQGYAQYAGGLAEWEAGYAQYEQGLAEYNAQKGEYEAGRARLEQMGGVPGSLAEAGNGLAALLEAIAGAGSPEEAAALTEAFLASAYTASGTLRALADELNDAGMAELGGGLAQAADGMDAALATGTLEGFGAAVGILAAVPGQLDSALAAATAELDAYLPLLAAGQAELDEAKAGLDAGKAELDEAKAGLDEGKAELDAAEHELAEGKAELDESWPQLEDARAQLASAGAQLSGARAQLAEGERELEDAKQELADGWAELRDAERELADGEKELEDGIQEYEDGLQEYWDGVAEAEEEFADAQREIDDARRELADLEPPEWYVYDRGGNPGYSGFSSNVDRISAIAGVIPYFFFLVAVLVCMTTMTRMVEEQRTGIGTFKALGFGPATIAAKFLLYAGVASFFGSLVGVVVGFYLFPAVIWDAYRMMYIMPSVAYASQPLLLIQSVGAMVLITVLAALSSCINALRSVPAELMRPKPPQKGTRVWLERLPFIWNRLKFSHKVTVRNLFRYKKRFFMTVIGVAGCTALLLTGFGLSDAIGGLVQAQYGDIEHYSLTVVLTDPSAAEADTSLNEAMAEEGEALYVHQFALEVAYGNATNADYNTYLYVAENTALLPDFITLNDVEHGGEVEQLPTDGVVVTQKLADRMGFGVGDTIEVNRANEAPVAVKVAAIVENYVYHYVYMAPGIYEQVTGEAPEYDQVLVRLADETADSTEVLRVLLEDGNVSGGVHFGLLRDSFDDQMGSLDSVIWLIIGCAGLLAFVVLYNLTNINITERQREIATLKVLGFYEGEVAGYVYRENIVLTCIGMVLGLFLGVFLHRYVINTAEIDDVMFQRVILPLSYVLAMAFTLLCAVVVNLVMLRKLKNIDMVESLKSAE